MKEQNDILVLGPMVRASTLPLRLAALEYGADRNIEVLFRTHCEIEKKTGCCVLQLSTCDAVTALRAAEKFAKDVSCIDINMGCPKHYSVSRCCGSALMSRPHLAEDIVKTLCRNLSVPVSVKTRVFAAEDDSKGKVDIGKTLQWAEMLIRSGAKVLAVHARTPADRSCIRPDDIDYLKGLLFDRTNLPVEDCESQQTSDSNSTDRYGFMISRAGLWDPSVFQRLREDVATTNEPSIPQFTKPTGYVGKESCDHAKDAQYFLPHLVFLSVYYLFQEVGSCSKPIEQLMKLLSRIVVLSARSANCPANTRYLLQSLLAGHRMLYSCGSLRSSIQSARDLPSLAEVLNCSDEVRSARSQQLKLVRNGALTTPSDGIDTSASGSTVALVVGGPGS
eukprot:gene30672-39950_t